MRTHPEVFCCFPVHQSTLVGCLTRRVIDNGRGSARSLVFRHKHEQENGRTSSVATEVMGFRDHVQVRRMPSIMASPSPPSTGMAPTAAGCCVFGVCRFLHRSSAPLPPPHTHATHTCGCALTWSPYGGLSPSLPLTTPTQVPVDVKSSRQAVWQTVFSRADKSVTLVDLCGHERYLKTTVFGLTGMLPDYAMLIVGANMGVSRMTMVRARAHGPRVASLSWNCVRVWAWRCARACGPAMRGHHAWSCHWGFCSVACARLCI
jgi:hypothetical protein